MQSIATVLEANSYPFNYDSYKVRHVAFMLIVCVKVFINIKDIHHLCVSIVELLETKPRSK